MRYPCIQLTSKCIAELKKARCFSMKCDPAPRNESLCAFEKSEKKGKSGPMVILMECGGKKLKTWLMAVPKMATL
jgi:hypothetical protein